MKSKKSLGQNFLKSKSALSAMISAGEVTSKDTIVEIGPGKGALTENLLATGATVIAIETDHELVGYLSEKFSVQIFEKKLQLIEADILKFDLSFLKNKKYKLIANIPYYITGAIIRKFLSSECQPYTMVLLVQKEVAERIVARDGKESILSIAVKVYGSPKLIMKVPARYFSPAPKVDSAIISIADISKNNLKRINEEMFFKVLHAGFVHKRKMLIGNLNILGISSATIRSIFEKIGISPSARAETLTIQEWLTLIKALTIHKIL